MGQNAKSTKHRKTRGFLSTAAGAAAPLSYGEERNAFGYATARGPLAGLSAYARQPARGPTMLAHLMAILAYVGLMLTHVEPKDPKNGTKCEEHKTP